MLQAATRTSTSLHEARSALTFCVFVTLQPAQMMSDHEEERRLAFATEHLIGECIEVLAYGVVCCVNPSVHLLHRQ